MAIEAGQILDQRQFGALATAQPQALGGFIEGHQVNFGVAPAVPPALDGGGEREIANPEAAALLVELPQQSGLTDAAPTA